MNGKRQNFGQATLEMVFLIPLFISLIGAGMFIVYSSWQGIKVQQAANVAGRIQGQERVGGGERKDAIQKDNGVGVDMTLSNGDADPTETTNREARRGRPPPSVYGRIYDIVHKMFGHNVEDQLYVPPPLIGQNIDKVKVVRVINLPKIPFFTWPEGHDQIKLVGTAWGGEDTFMYGLPRWGHTSHTGTDGDMEWHHQVDPGPNVKHD